MAAGDAKRRQPFFEKSIVAKAPSPNRLREDEGKWRRLRHVRRSKPPLLRAFAGAGGRLGRETGHNARRVARLRWRTGFFDAELRVFAGAGGRLGRETGHNARRVVRLRRRRGFLIAAFARLRRRTGFCTRVSRLLAARDAPALTFLGTKTTACRFPTHTAAWKIANRKAWQPSNLLGSLRKNADKRWQPSKPFGSLPNHRASEPEDRCCGSNALRTEMRACISGCRCVRSPWRNALGDSGLGRGRSRTANRSPQAPASGGNRCHVPEGG